jgi:hypothetical protein
MRELQIKFLLNKTTVRWFQMLNDFERERTCSLTQLAVKLQVTQRTISSDIKQIKDYFGNCIELVQMPTGYHFTENAPLTYLDKKRQLVAEEGLYQLLEAIFHVDLHPIEEWAYRLHVSESTLRRYLQHVSPILAAYELSFSFSPIDIIGDEANIRKFFKDFYYEADVTPHTLLPPRELVDLVMADMTDSPAQIKNSGVPPTDFFYSLYIMIERYRGGRTIHISDFLQQKIKGIPRFEHYKTFAKRIEDEYQVNLPAEEFVWLYLITLSKRTLTDPALEVKFVQEYNYWSELAEVSRLYVRRWALSFQDQEQIEALIHSFLLSKKINDAVAPILNLVQIEVKERAQQSSDFNENWLFLTENWEKLQYSDSFLADICAAFTLYTTLIQEFYYRPLQRIAVILEGNEHICQAIRARFLRYVGKDVEVLFTRVNELTTDYLQAHDVDLVVTNYSEYLTDYILDVDYLLLKAIPDKFDWLRVIKKINPQLGETLWVEEYE